MILLTSSNYSKTWFMNVYSMILITSYNYKLTIGSMVLLYMVTWIPSIFPQMLAYIPAPWIRHGIHGL